MNIKEAVDFETFYYHSLLETIIKKSRDKFPESLQQSIQNFVDFLASEISPLGSIEKLAHLQGTSDLSIFFSDLIERLSEYPPDEAIKNMDEYASDFLEIFKELARDQEWQHAILEDLLGETEEPLIVIDDSAVSESKKREEIDFHHFIYQELFAETVKVFSDKAANALETVEKLLHRLEINLPSHNQFDSYRSINAIVPIISAWEKLFENSFDSQTFEKYQQKFREHLSGFARSLLNLYQDDETLFIAFCEGKTPVTEGIPVSYKPEEEIGELIQAVEEEGGSKTEMEELTDEDKNLRWLLRDYIQHEIDELTKEINEHLERVNQGESQTIILDNFKVLKDLGQIHKYPLIEMVSSEINVTLKQFFKVNQDLSMAASSTLKTILKSFPEYIDAVLEGSEKNHIDTIIQLKNNFIESVTVTPVAVDEIKFEEKDQIQKIFSDVNRRFLEHVKVNFKELLNDLNNDNSKEYLFSELGHLKFWYSLLKVSGGENILEVFQNWLRNPQQQEKILKKQNVIVDVLQVLSENLFDITADDWTHHMEDLTRVEKVPSEVSVDKSLRAFVEVTQREITKILEELQKKELNFSDFLDNHLSPQLNQISDNSALIENPDLIELSRYLIEKMPLIKEQEEVKQAQIRDGLIHILSEVSSSLKELPSPIPITALKKEFDKVLANSDGLQGDEEQLNEGVQEIETTPTTELEETISEEQLDVSFIEETLGHLDELDRHVQRLSENLEDEIALKDIGNTLHSIKASSQMVQRQDISEITAPLENLTELIQSNQIRLLKQFNVLCQKYSKNVRKRLDDKKVDTNKFLDSIDKYISKYRVEADSGESAKKKSRRSRTLKLTKKTSRPKKTTKKEKDAIPEKDQLDKVIPEVPLLKLKEKDPELLEIFKEETKDRLDSIEAQLNLIDKFRYDKQTLQTLDHAIHEIRSAAKMLGFSEIGYLVDHLEELIEIIGKTDPENWRVIIPTFRKCVFVIRELTDKQQIEQQTYDEVADTISNFVMQFRQQMPDQTAEQDVPAPKKDTLSEESPKEAMIQSFLQEGKEFLEDMNFLLMKMEKEPQNLELMEQFLRSAHTLKGSSSMVYEHDLENLMHLTEELIEICQKRNELPTSEVIDLLFGVVDESEFILNAIAVNTKKKINNYNRLVKNLEKAIQQGEDIPEGAKSEPKPHAGKEKSPPFESRTEQIEGEKPRETHLRMDLKQIDNLLNEAAELVINNNQFRMQIERFKNYLPKLDVEGKNLDGVLWQLEKVVKEQERMMSILKPGLEDFQDVANSQKSHYEDIKGIIEHLQKFQENFTHTMQGIKASGKVYEEQLQKITKLSTQIHDEIMRARLIPIGMLFQRFNRPLRDIAKKYGKKVNLQMSGESTEIDRILADKLYEPMLHLLRNALDHGIETSAARKKRKKSEEGLIQITAQRERNNVLIMVEDDGQGIDVEKIRTRIAELKILSKKEIDKLSAPELYEFLMYPGFSTSKEVGTLSGRGIGLDIVRSQIHKLKGDLRIHSESGKFTRFVIRVPISITVTQAMLVEIAHNTYALPLLQVEETTNVSQENLTLREDGYFIKLRGMEIPIIYMSNLLKLNDTQPSTMSGSSLYPVIIVQDEGKKAGLLVDRIIQREEILIKNIGESLQRVKFIMGGTILADGKVVLVLDVPQIVFTGLRLKERSAALMPEDFRVIKDKPPLSMKPSDKNAIKKKIIKDRKPLILIVDDSLSVRKFLSSMLTKNNFEVESAKNGQTAIEMLSQKDYDAIITDLEMPQLSGYELIEQIRSDSRWETLPIIVLTGRASKQIEQQSIKLGANEFVIKPFKDKDLLEKLNLYIEYNE